MAPAPRIFIAVLATALSFSLGSILGFTAAVVGGWFDTLMSRFVDLLMAIPTLIFAPRRALRAADHAGHADPGHGHPRLRPASTACREPSPSTSTSWTSSRRQSCAARERRWIIFREILPNALSPLVSELGLRFIYAVLFLSALSFLGLGVQPPEADWGGMVKENKDGIVFGIAAALIPAAAIAALAISVNLVADWVLNRTTSLKGGRG